MTSQNCSNSLKSTVTGSDWLDEEEFNHVAYAYRWAPVVNQELVIKAFEELKEFIRNHLKEEDSK